MKTLLDVIIIIIFIICIWTGYKKGLIMGVGGILAIIVSLFLGHLVSTVVSYEVIPALRPFASGYLETRMTEEEGILDTMGYGYGSFAFEELLENNPDESKAIAKNTFMSLGISESVSDKLAEESIVYSQEHSSTFVGSMTEVLCECLTYVLGFILVFLLILITLTVLGNIPNLSFKLPKFNIINDVSGAVLGLITAVLFCHILVWALQFTGIIIGEEVLKETTLASKFISNNLLSKYLNY